MQIASVQSVPADELAWITKADMVEVDRVMIEDLHIELTQMMENAGRSPAHRERRSQRRLRERSIRQ